MSKFSDSTFYLAPSGYRETILFPQKPLSSIGHLSLGRASSATRTNPAGQVEEVCYNLLQYSEDFSNGYWTKANTSVTSNSVTAPNGTLTADTLTDNGTNSTHTIDIGGIVGVTTYSIYAKKGTSNYVGLYSSSALQGVYWNLDTGVFSSNIGSAPTASSITSVGDGWYRCSITITGTSTATLRILMSNNGSSFIYAGTGQTIYIWGAQLVQGNLPKDYLYTSDRLNFPRVDYSDGSASFLLEPQRTNLALNSEQFNLFTGSGNVTITTNQTIAPDGATTADKLSADSVPTFHRVYSTYATIANSTAYSFSVYAKADTLTLIQLALNTGFAAVYTSSPYANFNLSTGVVSQSGNGATASITNAGNGWYRCTITATSIASGVGEYNINLINSSTLTAFQTWSGATTDSAFVWGAQFEAGAYPTAYIPTTSSTVTRLADTFTRNNIYTNNLISSSGGTWFVELKNNIGYTRDVSSSGLYIDTSNSTLTNGFAFRNPSSGAGNQLMITKVVSGVLTPLYSPPTTTSKIAIKWNGSTADIFANGVKVISATAFTSTNMEFFTGQATDVPKYITQMALWNTPLSDSQCIELTGVAYTTPAQAYGSLNLVSESPDCLYTSVNTINRI